MNIKEKRKTRQIKVNPNQVIIRRKRDSSYYTPSSSSEKLKSSPLSTTPFPLLDPLRHNKVAFNDRKDSFTLIYLMITSYLSSFFTLSFSARALWYLVHSWLIKKIKNYFQVFPIPQTNSPLSFFSLNCNWMCLNRPFLQNSVFPPILYRDLPAKWPKTNEIVSDPAAHGVGGWKLVYSIPITWGIIPQKGVEKVFHFF